MKSVKQRYREYIMTLETYMQLFFQLYFPFATPSPLLAFIANPPIIVLDQYLWGHKKNIVRNRF